MDVRKDYVAPAIAAEDTLEQTSLACQASQPFPEINMTCFAGTILSVFAPDLDCVSDVSKGGAFGPSCEVFVPFPPEVVVLS